MHSFVQKSVMSVKTLNGPSKTKFSLTKGKDGTVHKLEGMRSSNNPDLLIRESISALNKRSGRVLTKNRVFKMKSSDIMNLLKESDTHKEEPYIKKVINAKLKTLSTLERNKKTVSKLGKKPLQEELFTVKKNKKPVYKSVYKSVSKPVSKSGKKPFQEKLSIVKKNKKTESKTKNKPKVSKKSKTSKKDIKLKKL